MNYYKYISSNEWVKKRESRKKLDAYCCRLCDEDGTRYRLEVHHRPSSYAKIPNERVEDDLITVCSRCHEPITASIREDRYDKRPTPELKTTKGGKTRQDKVRQDIIINIQNVSNIERKENQHVERDKIQPDFIGLNADAQWRISKPDKSDSEGNKEDYLQTD